MGVEAGSGKAVRSGAAGPLPLVFSRVLSLAATPTFALMAVLSEVFGGSGHGSGMHGSGNPFDDMVLMYVLMSVFHAAPWFTLCRRVGKTA